MDLETFLAPFRFVQEDPYKRIKELKDFRHKKVIGFLFPDVPEEMIHAFGVLPVAISGIEKNVNYARSYLPSFACTYNLAPLEAALQGKLNFIDGLIIPYSCDAMRAFSHVWEANFPHLFNHTIWLPKRVSGMGPKVFFKQELLRMKEALSAFVGTPILGADLQESIRVFNHNRKLLRSLHRQRFTSVPSISNADFVSIVRASTYMPKEEHSARVEELLDALVDRSMGIESEDPEFIRIFVFGSVCEDNQIYECFDRAKIAVVDDNLYNGTRYFSEDVAEHGDLFDNLVARHFRKDLTSCYHYRMGYLAEYLKQRVARNSIDGVIYLNPKYCEVLQLDYPVVKAVLDKIQIPLLLIETDDTVSSIGQIKTRIEAFGEVIRERKGGGI